jgi:hypothetical protein
LVPPPAAQLDPTPLLPEHFTRAEGKLMNDFTGRVRLDEQGPPSGTVRTLTVALDTAQYQLDMNHLAKQQAGGRAGEDVYGTFNMLMRRKVCRGVWGRWHAGMTGGQGGRPAARRA